MVAGDERFRDSRRWIELHIQRREIIAVMDVEEIDEDRHSRPPPEQSRAEGSGESARCKRHPNLRGHNRHMRYCRLRVFR